MNRSSTLDLQRAGQFLQGKADRLKDKIDGLIKLQDCDNRISVLDDRKKEGPIRIRKLEEELRADEVRFQKEYDRLDQLKKDIRSIEQDIQELDSRTEKSRIKLDNVKSNKEYTAALKELDKLNKNKSLMEDKDIQHMEEIEELEKRCLEYRDEQAGLKKRTESDRNEIETEMEELEKEMELFEKRKKEFCQAIDQDLLSKYSYLREKRGGLAIGPVVGGICQACNIRIPPQRFNELIKGLSLMICPNCQRIIYWGEDERFHNTSD